MGGTPAAAALPRLLMVPLELPHHRAPCVASASELLPTPAWIFNVLYDLVSTLKNSRTFGYRFTIGFYIQLFHSYCTVISQPDWPQIASQSCELGPRRQVAHFLVSQRIRLILGQKNCPRGPEL